jgi:uncharacterized protein
VGSRRVVSCHDGLRVRHLLGSLIVVDGHQHESFTYGNSMRRVIVRRSPVHGKGVFAVSAIRKGARILEYTGEVMSWSRAARRYRSSALAGHIFLFGLDDGRVIDGGRGGNSMRWLNRSCDANCIAVEVDGRVFIEAARNVDVGHELFHRLRAGNRRTSKGRDRA